MNECGDPNPGNTYSIVKDRRYDYIVSCYHCIIAVKAFAPKRRCCDATPFLFGLAYRFLTLAAFCVFETFEFLYENGLGR